MEKEPTEPRENTNPENSEAGREEELDTRSELPPDWRLTPPSEKRVIKRGAEVQLPSSAPKVPVKPPPVRRRKDEPRVRYGYRVEIPKDISRRQGERAGLLRRIGSYFLRTASPRERDEDKMDRAAWILAAVSGVLLIGLCFLPWFRVTWKLGTGEVGGGATTLKFLDLGWVGYAVPILAGLSAVVGVMAWLKKLPRLPVDAGVIIGLLALAVLIILLFVLIGNVGILEGAGRSSGLGSDFLANMFLTKNSGIAVYTGVIATIGSMLASLIRLSERNTKRKTVTQ